MDPKQENKTQEKTDLVSVSRKLRDVLRSHANGEKIIRTMAENISRRAESRNKG